MSGFLGSANEWILSWQQSRHGQDRDRRTGLPETKARRNRSRKQLTMEAIEERVLLSAPSLLAGPAVYRGRPVPVERIVERINPASATDYKKNLAVREVQHMIVTTPATNAAVALPANNPTQIKVLELARQQKMKRWADVNLLKKEFEAKLDWGTEHRTRRTRALESAVVTHNNNKRLATKFYEVKKSPKLEKSAADKNSVSAHWTADSTQKKIEKVTAAKASAMNKRNLMSAPTTTDSTPIKLTLNKIERKKL